MDDLLIQYLNKMLDLEESGYVEEAISLIDTVYEAFPSDKATILLEKGKLEFRNGFERNALIDLIKAYEISNDNEIYQLILEAYFFPNELEINEMLLNNNEILSSYPHYRNAYSENKPEIFPIWQDTEIIICVNKNEKCFMADIKHKIDQTISKNETILLANELWMDDITKCVHDSGIEKPFFDMEYPIYLVYEERYWMLLIQLFSLKDLAETGRVVFLVGEEKVREYFREMMVMFPVEFICNGFEEEYKLLLGALYSERFNRYNYNIKEIKKYYQGKEGEIDRNIKSGKPRILLLTSRFTSVLQYHTRDCMKILKNLGCIVELYIEIDNIHRTMPYMDEKIVQFKPDIIFCIDHFRFEYSIIPKEIVWITWIQDDLDWIMDKTTPSKLTNRDFIMNHFITWNEMKKMDYPNLRTMEAPIVANSQIYKIYELTERERREYEADICMVCHASDVENYITTLLANFKDNLKLKEIVEQLLNDYCQLVLKKEIIFYTKEEMNGFINEYTIRFFNLKFSEKLIDLLTNDIWFNLNQRIYRQAIADWLIEAGYHNLKLWGNGWLKSPKYKEYAMGSAQNGEVLSKILQSTKIVLGNNYNVTGAARAWESMLSGTFYMSNYVPPEIDATDIRKILKEGENLVIFHNKQDLLNKVEYYLSHETERKQMAEKGRQAALESMTYDVLMRKMLEFLKNAL